jgi:hypothetical protein
MNLHNRRIGGLVVTTLLVATALFVVRGKLGARSGTLGPSTPATADELSAAVSTPLPPAANLRIRVLESNTEASALLDPVAAAWSQAPATAILLNRTPRIYQTEPAQDHPIPRCEVCALRSDGKVILRLVWDDKTKNAPEAPPANSGKGGEPKQLYKRPTAETSLFPDAAAVMLPNQWTGPSFPSLLMGDKRSPARLYYWSASSGAAELTASGRATPQPNGRSFPFRAQHAEGKWTLTMEVPDQGESYPIAFAVWDGQSGDRDGLKFFSIWYVLTRN